MVTLTLGSIGTLRVLRLIIFRLSVVLIPIAYTIVSFGSKLAVILLDTRINRGSGIKLQTKFLSVHAVCLVGSEISVGLSNSAFSNPVDDSSFLILQLGP